MSPVAAQADGSPLLTWLDRPAADRGIRFARGEAWELWPYERLAVLARRAAAGLIQAGVRQDDVVAIIERSSPGFVASLFGALLAGAVPAPIAPPMTFQDPDHYEDHVAGLLRAARPAAVLAG